MLERPDLPVVMLAAGKSAVEVYQRLAISGVTRMRLKKQFSEIRSDKARRLPGLKLANYRLKELLAEAELHKRTLR